MLRRRKAHTYFKASLVLREHGRDELSECLLCTKPISQSTFSESRFSEKKVTSNISFATVLHGLKTFPFFRFSVYIETNS